MSPSSTLVRISPFHGEEPGAAPGGDGFYGVMAQRRQQQLCKLPFIEGSIPSSSTYIKVCSDLSQYGVMGILAVKNKRETVQAE